MRAKYKRAECAHGNSPADVSAEQVRFRITAEPIAMRLCWCRLCQYLAAGNATVNVVFPERRASRSKASSRDYRSVADSGSVMHRRFCPSCGTQLFSAAESRPHLVIVRNGALDDTELDEARRHHLDCAGAGMGLDRRGSAATPAASRRRSLGAERRVVFADTQ